MNLTDSVYCFMAAESPRWLLSSISFHFLSFWSSSLESSQILVIPRRCLFGLLRSWQDSPLMPTLWLIGQLELASQVESCDPLNVLQVWFGMGILTWTCELEVWVCQGNQDQRGICGVQAGTSTAALEMMQCVICDVATKCYEYQIAIQAYILYFASRGIA